jgi:2-isopropylmalate synthase
LIKAEGHLDLPRRLQVEFSRVIQSQTDATGLEMTADDLWQAFEDEYLPSAGTGGLERWGRFELLSTRTDSAPQSGVESIQAEMRDGDGRITLTGTGNGPIDAFAGALNDFGVDVAVLDYSEHALSGGGDASAAAYVECQVEGQTLWGVGIDPSITTASLKAIISAINRALRS